MQFTCTYVSIAEFLFINSQASWESSKHILHFAPEFTRNEATTKLQNKIA